MCERHATRLDTEQDEVADSVRALEDLVGDAAHDAGDVVSVEDARPHGHVGSRHG
jgi:hypothetical protein